MTLSVDLADQIRAAHYVMDGPADRPKTVAECHDMIGDLIGLLGALTGITDASAVSPLETDTAKREGTTLRRAAAEWDALTPQQQARVIAGGVIVGIPMRCEFCDEAAAWSSGDVNARVACYDLRHIAMAESTGAIVPPMSLLAKMRCDCRDCLDRIAP